MAKQTVEERASKAVAGDIMAMMNTIPCDPYDWHRIIESHGGIIASMIQDRTEIMRLEAQLGIAPSEEPAVRRPAVKKGK
jgi:hypothetical protein